MLKIRQIISPIVVVRKSVIRFSSTAAPKEEKIKIDDFHINFVKVGNGDHKVFFMPGTLGTIWTEALPQLQGFDKDKFTIIAWDPPGYGKSRPPEKVYGTDFYERDAVIAYKFMKALEIPKYSVMGFSGGGIASLILSAKYPHVVNKLVGWGVLSYIVPEELEVMKKFRDINAWSSKKKQSLIDTYGEKVVVQYWSDWVEGMSAIFNQKDANICVDMLKDIKCPTFLLLGQKDPIITYTHLSFLKDRIRDCRTHTYPEGSHSIHLQYSEDFNKRVQDFLLEP